jgi:hypothetical protein
MPGGVVRILGSPPLPQPEGERTARVRRSAASRLLIGRVFFFRRVFQKKRRDAGRRQRRVLLRFAWTLCAVALGLIVVMVLMVATAFWAAVVRAMLEGSREHVAYWPGVMGVQLRTTSPL